MNELKGCPFCGVRGTIEYAKGMQAYAVVCANSSCESAFTHWHKLESGAVAEWNTRVDGWVSVDDRLPVAGAKVLILLEVGENIERGEYIGDGDFKGNWCNRRGKNYCYKVTHWMASPELPKAKS